MFWISRYFRQRSKQPTGTGEGNARRAIGPPGLSGLRAGVVNGDMLYTTYSKRCWHFLVATSENWFKTIGLALPAALRILPVVTPRWHLGGRRRLTNESEAKLEGLPMENVHCREGKLDDAQTRHPLSDVEVVVTCICSRRRRSLQQFLGEMY
jgi:hypothetical protein